MFMKIENEKLDTKLFNQFVYYKNIFQFILFGNDSQNIEYPFKKFKIKSYETYNEL